MTRIPARIAILTALATLAIGGCSADKPPGCDSLDAVRTTMQQIRNANVAENGLTQLRADLQQLRRELQQLRTDAEAQFAPQVANVKTATDQFSASIAAAREAPDVAHLSAVRTSLGGLQTSIAGLRDAMSGTC